MRTLSLILLCTFVAGLLSVAAVSYAQEEEHTISINLVDADIRDALSVLFRGTDKNFVLTEGAATNARISVKLDGVTFDTALHLILQQAGLQYKVAGNVYTISPAANVPPVTGTPGFRPTTPTAPRPTTPTTTAPRSSLDELWGATPPGGSGTSTYGTTTGQGTDEVIKTIKVYYADATEIATLFGGEVATGAFGGRFGGGGGGGGYGGYGGIGGVGAYGGIGGIGGGLGGYGGYGSYGGGGYGGYGSYGGGSGGYGSSRYGSGGYGGYGTSRYGSSRYGSSGYGGYGSSSPYGYRAVPPPPPG